MARILYFIAEDWNVLSHFRPMLQAAAAEGHEVVIATRVRKHRREIEQLGYRVVPLEGDRGSLSPLETTRSLWRIVAVLRKERPDVVHCVSVRLSTLVGPIARLGGVPRLIVAPIGLGHLWIEDDAFVRVLRSMSRFVIGTLLNSRRTTYVFENGEDPAEFGLRTDDPRVRLVGGSGVDAADFTQLQEPPRPPFKIAVLARMTRPKGVLEAVDAVNLARRSDPTIELHLFGEPDTSNPRALGVDHLRGLCDQQGIFWHGSVAPQDVPAVLTQHHVVMLLSHREGLPRALVEAAAAARAIVATDVTGCHEIIRHEREGLLIAKGDVAAAAELILRLARDDGLRLRLGEAARARFEMEYTDIVVTGQFRQIYRTVAGEPITCRAVTGNV